MDNELRILNGLHRGATLPLDGTTLLLGAHDDADVVIVDPGIVAHHASLQPRESGWLLTADAGQIFSADSLVPQELLDLWSGVFFRLGETWLVISPCDAAWQPLPPMPQPELESEFDRETDFDPASEDLIDINAEDGAAFDDDDPEAVPAFVPAETLTPAGKIGAKRSRKWMVAPAGLLALLVVAATYSYSSKPSLPVLHSLQMSTRIADTPDLPKKVVSTEKKIPVMSDPAKLTPEGLASAFRKRMKDADLFAQFDMDLNELGWSMRAHLDDAESARFERILKAFVLEHKITFPINAKVGSAESMLPFTIRQIVSGTNAGIVTDDGHRFYVGDEFLGVRLVAVTDNRLTFMGKRKIEVIW
ncbi:MAG: type III secretion protein D [Burkholderiaceae bacterium]|jgi:type III secretion protein D